MSLGARSWEWQGKSYPYLQRCRERTIYYWTGSAFEVAARYSGALVKLVPTRWGPPVFEIDGIKMLPSQHIDPYEDAASKVALVQPAGKSILDTCGGLGYFAACCHRAGAASVQSYEKSEDVLWIRSLNPWSPPAGGSLVLHACDILERIPQLQRASFDAVLHDPPRFGIAGELYSQVFYGHLARVLRPGGRLFHYTGSPNKLTSDRDVPNEVATRLKRAGFAVQPRGDGILAIRSKSARRSC